MQVGKIVLALAVLILSVYSLLTESHSVFTLTLIFIALLIFLLGLAEYKEEKIISGIFAMALGIIVFSMFLVMVLT